MVTVKQCIIVVFLCEVRVKWYVGDAVEGGV